MIRLSQITKIYNAGRNNEYTALKGIDLDLETGKSTVLVGPSGSGKTTLLSIIGCMSRPTSGRIWINDMEVTSLPERFAAEVRRNTFGFVFQNYNLIRGLTVLENTMIPAYPTGRKHRAVRERAMDLLCILNLEKKYRQEVESLSGGEQQRAAIARSLINDPSFIIADEPTAHLDTELAGNLLEIMSRFKNEGKTIIIASHDPLVFQSTMADRIIRMRDGKIV